MRRRKAEGSASNGQGKGVKKKSALHCQACAGSATGERRRGVLCVGVSEAVGAGGESESQLVHGSRLARAHGLEQGVKTNGHGSFCRGKVDSRRVLDEDILYVCSRRIAMVRAL